MAAQITSNVKILNKPTDLKKGELPSVAFVDMIDIGAKKNLDQLK